MMRFESYVISDKSKTDYKKWSEFFKFESYVISDKSKTSTPSP